MCAALAASARRCSQFRVAPHSTFQRDTARAATMHMRERAVPPRPTCHRKQQILVIRNRRHVADCSLAVWSPQCHTSRSEVDRAILIPTVCRAWLGGVRPRWKGALHRHRRRRICAGAHCGAVHARLARIFPPPPTRDQGLVVSCAPMLSASADYVRTTLSNAQKIARHPGPSLPSQSATTPRASSARACGRCCRVSLACVRFKFKFNPCAYAAHTPVPARCRELTPLFSRQICRPFDTEMIAQVDAANAKHGFSLSGKLGIVVATKS